MEAGLPLPLVEENRMLSRLAAKDDKRGEENSQEKEKNTFNPLLFVNKLGLFFLAVKFKYLPQ